jgi:hypothetical protein
LLSEAPWSTSDVRTHLPSADRVGT